MTRQQAADLWLLGAETEESEMKNTVELEFKTTGFEDTIEQLEELADACDDFPAQVQFRNCRDCVINIYPHQNKYIEGGNRCDCLD